MSFVLGLFFKVFKFHLFKMLKQDSEILTDLKIGDDLSLFVNFHGLTLQVLGS